ncbi:MAG: 1-(5-phosphoribosyl)-5-[(5-phosphoribosylamino)methylideneamino] imidazole-4-carboxamide isomerase, partial [Pseudomonadota bacterium]
VAVAGRWVNEGARRLHLVDLDGAFAGEPQNAQIVRAIREHYPTLPLQIGGGIRNREIAASYIDAGVSFVIIGTQAVREPAFVTALCREFPGQVIVGLDARDGQVAVEGWAEGSGVDATELALQFEGDGVAAIVYTDIARDGMMQGVNVEATAALASAVNIPVIASGGVTDLDDIEHLCEAADAGISGSIIGRALYEGTIDLADAKQLVGDMLGEGLA